MPATLEPPKTTAPRKEGEYLVWDNVPVWKEHVSRDGVKFDKPALDRVVARCNERIEDTGDYAPVVIRHTEDRGAADPPVVGLAGPFTLGKYGKKRPKATIFAQLRIHEKYAAEADRYPRLSVEYWASEKDPTGGFFDPISLLGAETPELDLGLRGLHVGQGDEVRHCYSKSSTTLRKRRYSTAPAGANTAVPEVLGEDAESHQYAKENTGMSLSPEDIAQIVDAFQPVIEAMRQEQDAKVMKLVEELKAEIMAMVPGADGLGDDDLSDEPPLGDEMPPEEGAPPDDALPPDAAMPAGEPDAEAAAVPMESNTAPMGDDEEKQDDDEAGPLKAAKYQRERDEYKSRYHKLLTEHRETAEALEAANGQLAELKGETLRATRYSKLLDLQTEGYVIEPDEELAECSSFDEAAFDKHVERIRTKYQRVPMGTILHQKPAKLDGVPSDEKRRRYSRRAADIYAAAIEKDKSAEIKFEDCWKQAKQEIDGQ